MRSVFQFETYARGSASCTRELKNLLYSKGKLPAERRPRGEFELRFIPSRAQGAAEQCPSMLIVQRSQTCGLPDVWRYAQLRQLSTGEHIPENLLKCGLMGGPELNVLHRIARIEMPDLVRVDAVECGKGLPRQEEVDRGANGSVPTLRAGPGLGEVAPFTGQWAQSKVGDDLLRGRHATSLLYPPLAHNGKTACPDRSTACFPLSFLGKRGKLCTCP